MTIEQNIAAISRRLSDLDGFALAEQLRDEIVSTLAGQAREILMTRPFYDALTAALKRTIPLFEMAKNDPWRNVPEGYAAVLNGLPIKIVPGTELWFEVR